ncbi:MAG TPA: LPS assembly lipoprotein LptE [Nitrospiraceae bacterium]|nr:LPS assembly lipoprotein LptE [Nitrospiraceae bacterium]
MAQVKSLKAKGKKHVSLVDFYRFAFYFCFFTLYVAGSPLLTACGYQFRVEGAGPTIGGTSKTQAEAQANAPTLSVVNFDNRSFEPNLEVKYTKYARHEFASGSGAQVVIGSEPSDLTLRGQILSVIIPSLTFSINQTLESRVTVMVAATVEENRTQKVIWSQLLTASSEFFVTKDLQFNRVLQNRALEQAGQFIAQDMAARFQNHLDQYGMAAAPGAAPLPAVPAGGLGGGRR